MRRPQVAPSSDEMDALQEGSGSAVGLGGASAAGCVAPPRAPWAL